MDAKKYSVFDKFEEMKVKYFQKDLKACGQLIFQAYLKEYNVKPEKEERLIRFWKHVVNVYPESFAGKMGELIEAYLNSTEREEILNRPKQWELNRIKHKEDFEKGQAKRDAKLGEEKGKVQDKKQGKQAKGKPAKKVNNKPIIASKPGPPVNKPAITSKPGPPVNKPAVIPPLADPVQSSETPGKRVRQRIKVSAVKLRK